MVKVAKFIGLDVHKDTIALALSEGGPSSEAIALGTVPNDFSRLLKKLLELGEPQDLRVAYEAGPTGYPLCRKLLEHGIACIVVAPNKVPRLVGRRVKTDQRDAKDLAQALRMGALQGISLPDRACEALRDLIRAREDVVRALRRSRQQLKGFLLRHDLVWRGRSSWTMAHFAWMRTLRFSSEAQTITLTHYLGEIDRLVQSRDHLEGEIERLMPTTIQYPLFRALQALRGVSTIVAATLTCELHDVKRFQSAGRLMSFVGLTPSEHSSGDKRVRMSITKGGNAHVRRVLVEAAWAARLRPARTVRLLRRQQGVAPAIVDIAWKAQQRLHKRYVSMRLKGRPQNLTIVALARELVGFVWAIGQEVELQPAA